MKLIPERLPLSDEELEEIQALAACNFSPELIAKRMGIEPHVFFHFFNNTESDLYQAYDAGKMSATFEIMKKQLELAKSGNITAAQIFLKESKEIEIANLRNKCLFGE